MRVPATLFITGLVAATAAAQTTVVFPKDHTTREGYSYDNSYSPLSSGVSRIQMMLEQWDLKIPDGAKITRFGFRQNGDSALTGKQVQIEVSMGKCRLDTETLTSTFANNYHGSPVVVVQKKILTLPTFGKPVTQPSPNIVWITLDQPYVHDASKNLIIDISVFNNSNGNQRFDYRLDLARYWAPTEEFGQGCKTSANTYPKMTTQPLTIGKSWYSYLSSAPASSPILYMIGGPKLPGGIDLAGIGAPTCRLYTIPVAIVPGGATSTSGSASVRFPIPLDLRLYGQMLTSQCLIPDLFANAAHFVTSSGISVQVGTDPRMARVVSVGSTTNTTGGLVRGVAPVTVIEYQ